MNGLFQGCATALITPFKNGSIDWDALDQLVESQIAAGISALVAAGTTGEPATMTWEEHIAVIRRVVEVTNHRIPVIAGTGSNSTLEAMEAAKQAEAIGADAQLLVTPYYNKTSQAGLVAHFTAVADCSSLPVYVYNVPSRTGINISPAALKQIVSHPKVVAVKEANSDVAQAMEKLRLCGSDAVFYSGNDDLVLPLMACGYQGVISVVSNVMPEEMVRMTSLALKGDNKGAAEIQLRLMPFINALFSETSPIPVKAAMAMLGRCQEELRLPLVPMQEATRANLVNVMRDLGLL